MGTPVDTTLQNDRRDDSPGPVLLVKLKNKILQRYPLNSFRTIVGRSSECDIVLERSSRISRNHAQILVVDGEVVVEDLGSRNGIYVNRKPCKRRTLQAGDRIAIGHYRLYYMDGQSRPAEQAESVGEISKLIRLWRGAAVTAAKAGFRFGHTADNSGRMETEFDIETEVEPHVDDDRLAADDEANGTSDQFPARDSRDLDLSAHVQSGDDQLVADDEAIGTSDQFPVRDSRDLDLSADVHSDDGRLVADDEAIGTSDDFPVGDSRDTHVRSDDEQEQMMEKAVRLVGHRTVPEEDLHKPVPANGNSIERRSVRNKLRRLLNPRRKLPR